MGRKFYIRTFGCQMNEHDSERIAGVLSEEGLEPAGSIDDADVVVLNTCCIRENADNRLYGTLGHLKSMKAAKPGMQIAVGGCLAQKDKGAVQDRADYVDVVFGTHNVGSVAKLLGESRFSGGPVMEIVDSSESGSGGEMPSLLPVKRPDSHTAWVTIQTGCNNKCAFCVVPFVRGKEISRPVEDIVQEVEGLSAKGVREVTLLGQNVNSYGRDITGRRPLFAELLRRVGEVEGVSRVRFTSPHPKDLRPETVAAMAEVDAVCEQLHLPVQSGSDRVLSGMHRGYTAQRYLEKLAMAREAIPDLAVSTDIIVGFPGETDEDFEQTLELVAKAEYDSAFTFIFSPRSGTEAAGYADRFVDPGVVAERFEALKVTTERSALAKHMARVGLTEEVMVIGASKREARLSGRTRQNKLVHFEWDGAELPAPGSLLQVEITAAAPHHLSGRVKELAALA